MEPTIKQIIGIGHVHAASLAVHSELILSVVRCLPPETRKAIAQDFWEATEAHFANALSASQSEAFVASLREQIDVIRSLLSG